MKKKKILGVIGLGAAGALCGGLACVYGVAANANTVAPEESVLPATAYLGDAIALPEKTIEINGTDVEASILVTSPDGGQFTGKMLVADEIGKYTVEYYAYADGERISLPEESIVVVRKASDLFTVNEYATAKNGTFIHDDSIKGVRAALSNGGEIAFSKVLDITELTKDDVLLEFIAEGTQEGQTDFSGLTIMITDVEDKNNYLEVSMVDSTTNCFGLGTYVKAGGNGQQLAGYEGTTLNTLPQFGTPIFHTFKKQAEGHTYRTAKLYYDYANKAMYVADDFFASEPQSTLIADFDDPATFATVWSGFKSGKVRISITASGLSAASANLVITKVAGYDLSQDDFVDETAPEVIIDYAGESAVPVSVVGSSYRVFDVILNDNLDNDVQLDVSAYYKPTLSATETDVAITDGYIRTDYAGIYTLRYVVTDRSGNVTEKEVDVLCSATGEPIEVLTTDEDKTVLAYDKVVIGGVESVLATGGNGNLDVTAVVYDPDGEEVKLIKNGFTAEKTGEYKVVYTATDYLGYSASCEITVTSTAPQKPIFTGDLFLPDMLIKDFAYTLPDYTAKEMSGETLIDVPVKKYVNGVETADGAFIASGEAVTVKYVATGATGEKEYEITLPVTDGNNGKDQDKYFYGNADGIVNEKECVAITVSDESTVRFANAVHTHNFSLGFTFGETELNFGVMEIVLTDAKDKNLSVTLTLSFADGKAILTTPFSDVEGTFTDSQGEYELTYTNADKALKDKNNGACGNVSFDDDGDIFEGFSDTVYLSVTFKNVDKTSTLRLTSINNQPLGYRTSNYNNRRDRIEPEIYLQESYAVKNTLGSTAKVSAGVAYDVLGYVKTFTVTVYDPEDNLVLDGVSAKEFYEFELTKYGDYRVQYTAIDNHGVENTYAMLISVVEKEAPKLTVSSVKATYKLGSSVKVPKYKVEDNSGVYYVDVMLIMPSNEMRLLLHNENGEEYSKLTADDGAYEAAFKVDAKTFKPQMAGKYVLRFFAYDDNFNYTTVEQEFTVVEK